MAFSGDKDELMERMRPIYEFCQDLLAANQDSQFMILPEREGRGVQLREFIWANIEDHEGPFIFLMRHHGEGRPLRVSVHLRHGKFNVVCFNNIGEKDRFQSVRQSFYRPKEVLELLTKIITASREKFVSIHSLGYTIISEISREEADVQRMQSMERSREAEGFPEPREIEDPDRDGEDQDWLSMG